MILCFNYLQIFLTYFLTITVLPVFLLPIFFYKMLVHSIVYFFKPEFGKSISSRDTVLEEEGLNKLFTVPKSSLVNSIVLQGSISIEELRDSFRKKVLEKDLSLINHQQKSKSDLANNNNNSKDDKSNLFLRYPELKQYPVSFMGYTFWKADEKFQLDDHIVEEEYLHFPCKNLSAIHQHMLNKSFNFHKSPWEMVLINNYKSNEKEKEVEEDAISGGRSSSSPTKTLIITRFHHIMLDAKSILKLFVECLGEQTLTSAKPQEPNRKSFTNRFIKTPISFLYMLADFMKNAAKFWSHPWKISKSRRHLNYATPQIVKISQKLSLADVKIVGKESGGTAASVILAIISGAIETLKPDVGDLFCAYILPKDNHPETLRNHMRFGAVIIPTGEESSLQRLNKCHRDFRKLKASQLGNLMQASIYISSILFNPLRWLVSREIMSFTAIGVTNIAGEGNGFSIRGRKCEEFVFSVGTLASDAGVAFCVSSFKDHLRIVVISKGGILKETEAEQLASNMGKELQKLKELTINSTHSKSTYIVNDIV